MAPARISFGMTDFAAAAIAVLLALLAACTGCTRVWLLPLAAGPAAGAAGWSILPASHGPLLQLAGTVALLLPITVIVLAASLRRIPEHLADTAAACGASPLQTLMHARIRPALPALGVTLLLAFVLARGLSPMLAPLAVRP